jgi:crescentin
MSDFAKTFGGILATREAVEVEPLPNGAKLPTSYEICQTTLEVIGREHEEVRARFAEIIRKSNDLISLQADFIEAAEQVGLVLQDSERVNSELLEMGLKLGRAETAHESMKNRHRSLQEESEARRRETILLQADIQRFGDLVDARENRIAQLEAEVNSAWEALQVSNQTVEILEVKSKKTGDELVAARRAIEANDEKIELLQSEAAERNANLTRAEFDVQRMQRALGESQDEAKAMRETIAGCDARAADLSTALGEARAELATRSERADTLESSLADVRLELDVANLIRQQQADAHAAEVEDLKANLAAATSRVRSSEQMLAETSGELQSRANELRKAQRYAQELEGKVGPLDERVKAIALENANLSESVHELGASRSRLANRSQALVRAMKDQKAELENSNQRVRLLEERVAADRAQYETVLEGLRGDIQGLIEQLEKEKLAHQLDASALEAARARLRHIVNGGSMQDLLTRVDRAMRESS